MIAKTVKALKILGYIMGPIIDVLICILQINNQRQRYKKREIGKKEFYKFLVQKVAELLTNLFFAVITPFCSLIPVVGVFIVHC